MRTMKRVAVYVVLMAYLLAWLDWGSVHCAWWNYGEWCPQYGASFQAWSVTRQRLALLSPASAPLAENLYYVLMEVQAGEAEQAAVLPVGYSGNPFNPTGRWSHRWGQGEGAPWREVSMVSLYLYWVPATLVWWLVVGPLFRRDWRRKGG